MEDGLREKPKSPREGDGTRATIALFVWLVVSIKSMVGALLLISSQLVYEGPAKEWFFFGVTAMPSVAATAVGLTATGSDRSYDVQYGIARTVHFRIVITSVLLCLCVTTLALMPQGAVQVALAFVICCLAEAVVYVSVQFVAVLDPTFTAWVSLAGMLSYLVPMATLAAFSLDTGVQWGLAERLMLFAPTLALNLVSICTFQLAWPNGAGIDGLRALTGQLQEGLNKLERSEDTPSLGENLTKFAPYPYYFATIFGVVLCLTGGLVLPLIGLTDGSGAQARLILVRFLGEIVGQVLATAVASLGLTNATYADLGLNGGLTAVRLAMTVLMVPMMVAGSLPWAWMFVFRLVDTYVFSCVQVMVVQACSVNARRAVVRNDLLYRNAAGFLGLAACAGILAT